jgi:aspartyl-tRNA(Asn)/glutamyl-tRNA(Gln) amidotransferase subunit B
LLEIVTEPDFTSARHVALFAQELQRLVQFLGVSAGQMQMGHMRFEPNINVHITDQDGVVHKTAITEIKNLNSFSVLERATAYEIRRQVHQWEQTGSLGRKSTYGWDESAQATFHQRDKEEAHDYRYFPDPDLAPVEVSGQWLAELKQQVGELPAARRKRYVEALGLSPADAAALASDRRTGDLFEALVRGGAAAKRAANLVTNTLAQLANERGVAVPDLGVSPGRLGQVLEMVAKDQLAASNAPVVLREMLDTGADPREVAEKRGLLQGGDDGAVDAAIDALIAQNPKELQDVRGGKQAAMNALVGKVMRGTKGLNPKTVQERLRAKLNG